MDCTPLRAKKTLQPPRISCRPATPLLRSDSNTATSSKSAQKSRLSWLPLDSLRGETQVGQIAVFVALLASDFASEPRRRLECTALLQALEFHFDGHEALDGAEVDVQFNGELSEWNVDPGFFDATAFSERPKHLELRGCKGNLALLSHKPTAALDRQVVLLADFSDANLPSVGICCQIPLQDLYIFAALDPLREVDYKKFAFDFNREHHALFFGFGETNRPRRGSVRPNPPSHVPMSFIAALRILRTLGRGTVKGLPEAAADRDPIDLFDEWFQVACDSGLYLPEAVTLATATPGGKPSARMVLLKGFDETGFTFYTNYGSRKASELAANPRAALVAYWGVLLRQVRIEGSIKRCTHEESAAYFATRSRGSKIGAWASRQSATLKDRESLLSKVTEITARFDGTDVPLPDFWGGFTLVPESIEFWQCRANRLHDRLVFTRNGDAWTTRLLFP